MFDPSRAIPYSDHGVERETRLELATLTLARYASNSVFSAARKRPLGEYLPPTSTGLNAGHTGIHADHTGVHSEHKVPRSGRPQTPGQCVRHKGRWAPARLGETSGRLPQNQRADVPRKRRRGGVKVTPRRAAQGMVATVVRSIFAQPDAETTWAQLERVSLQLQEKFPVVATMLLDAATTSSPSPVSPRNTCGRSGPTIPQERLDKELRRRSDVVGVFPNRPPSFDSCDRDAAPRLRTATKRLDQVTAGAAFRAG
jgi:hypothetical protein